VAAKFRTGSQFDCYATGSIWGRPRVALWPALISFESEIASAHDDALLVFLPGRNIRTNISGAVLSGEKMSKRTPCPSSHGAIRLILFVPCCVAIIVGAGRPAISLASSAIFVRSTVTTSTELGGGNSVTLGHPPGMAAGDLLIAQLAVRGGSDITLTSPYGWTLIRRDNYDGSIAQAIYRRIISNPAAEPLQYTWYFDSGNDAAAGIADYAAVSSFAANSGQSNPSSNYVLAPSVQIPGESAAVTVIGFFGVASGEPVVPPAQMSQRWSFRASGWGIGVGMGDLSMAPGQSTGNQTGTVSNAASSTGALVVLAQAAATTPTPSPTPSSGPTPTPTPSPTPAPTGVTYYVSPRGNDSNNGTSQISAWGTIQHAANVMRVGDTAIVLAGTYNERVSISRSGQNGKPITFQVAAGALATMKGFQINASYVQILGFSITNNNQSDETAWGIHLTGSNNTVSRNNIHDLCAEGIYVSGDGNPNSPGTANNIISHNSFIRDEMAGGQIEGQNNLVAYNTVSGTFQYPPNCYTRNGADADGFRFFGNGHVFRSNRITNIPVPGSQYNPNPHTDCFQSWGPATNMTFDSNWCQWPAAGTSSSGGSNHIGMVENSRGNVSNLRFMNNVFVNMYQGLLVDGDSGSNITGLQFDNNTIDNVTQEGVVLIENVPAAQIINNIFCNVGSGGDNYLSANSNSSNFTAVDNDMWMSNGSMPGTYGSNARYINENPQFVDFSGLNFHLSALSPMIDAGQTLSQVTHDYDGVSRPEGAAYDIGAFEYH
jgi:hypothetical protein